VQEKLMANDGAQDDWFGHNVAIDGDKLAVGAPGVEYTDTPGNGSTYMYIRLGAMWMEQAKLTASDGAAGNQFGREVAISDDTVVVGAKWDDNNGDHIGSAYVFIRSGTTWTEQAKLTANDGAADDWFGESVAISGDTIFIGADHDDDNGDDRGSVYMYVRAGTTWTQQAKPMADDGVGGDHFGFGMAVSGDRLVIGAYGNDDNGGSSGSAYVFDL
jgi:hypothetical protein